MKDLKMYLLVLIALCTLLVTSCELVDDLYSTESNLDSSLSTTNTTISSTASIIPSTTSSSTSSTYSTSWYEHHQDKVINKHQDFFKIDIDFEKPHIFILKSGQDKTNLLNNSLDDLSDEFIAYNSDYFSNNTLILIGIMSTSGSNKYNINTLKISDDSIDMEIVRTQPLIITGDVVYWLFFLTVLKEEFSGNQVITTLSFI